MRPFAVAKAASTTSVTATDATYDGQPHGGSAVATGAGGLNLGLAVSYSGRNATSYGPSATAPTNAGDYTASASYGGDANHNGSSGTKGYTVAKATATLTLGGLTGHTYSGSPQTATATTSPAGLTGVTITYNGSATAPTGAGSYAVAASLAHANYTASLVTGTMAVAKATPPLTWNNPADIAAGTALSATQLNATASAAGTFTYTPAAGTVLSVGNNQTLSVSFTPTDTTNYNGVSATAHINVVACPAAASSTFAGTSPIAPGAASTLSWNVPYANSVSISSIGGTLGPFGSTGSTSVTPSLTTTYTLSATGAGACQAVTKQTTVVVQTCPTSSNTTFAASNEVVAAGESVDLTWAAQGISSVRIEQECDPHDAGCDPAVYEIVFAGGGSGGSTVTVQPAATTTYTLTVTGVTGCAGTVTKQVTVSVPGDALSCSPDAYFNATRRGPFSGCLGSKLEWSVPDATSLSITDEDGTDFGTYTSTDGTISVGAGLMTTFYLTAHLPTGGSVPASCGLLRFEATNPCQR